MAGGQFTAGVFTQGGARMPTWMNNLSIVRATTTNAGDSIKITSADGTALSASNYGWVTLPSTSTAGAQTTFSMTADVTILLTGAHWQPSSGAGTGDDLTGAINRVLAINSNGSLVWGVANLGGRQTLLSTDASATQANITLPEHVLTSAAVNATNTCREVGWFRADYDDTGGAASKLWAVQTGIGDVVTGQSADGLWQPWNIAATGFTTAFATSSTRWTQNGRNIRIEIKKNGSSASSQTYFRFVLPAKALKTGYYGGVYAIVDNSVSPGVAGAAILTADATNVDIYTADGAANWTAANNKSANMSIVYEVGPAASFIE